MFESEEEGSSPSTPKGVVQTIDQGTSGIAHSSTPPPPPPSPLPHTPTLTPPPSPPHMLFSVANIVKIPKFRGYGSKDPI